MTINNNPETLRAPFDARTLQAVIDLLDRVVMVAAPSAKHPGDREVIAYVGGLSSARNYVSGMLDASLRRAMEERTAAVDLDDYRARRAAAMAAARAYHPSAQGRKKSRDAEVAYSPADAIETAQEFHARIDEAERGVAVEDTQPWYVTRSRARKARRHNTFAVVLLMVTSLFLGAIGYAASAKADGPADAWEWEYGPAACAYLDDPENNSVAGLTGVILGAQEMGLTPEQAGEAVAASVLDICPRHDDLLRGFIMRYGPRQIA
jgi:hypothetical protein